MARPKALTNSHRKIERAVLSSTAMSASRSRMPDEQHPRRGYNDPDERRGEKDFPAEPHQLIVPVARHDRLHHGEQEKEEPDFQHEPDYARNGGERPDRNGRQPAAEEQDRQHRTHEDRV